MALIDEVQAILNRLADHGWRELFAVHGFDIDAPDLAVEVLRPLETIDRDKKGFEDFASGATRAIEPGRPSHSLLYHALASPNVHPTGDGQPSSDPEDYPMLTELDTLENFIYSLVADREDLDDTFVAVFAYQYRVASRTSHLRHADMAYSRTGVARVGTTGPNYDRSRRSFWVLPDGGANAIAVLPARYGVFLARLAKAGAAGSVQSVAKRSTNEDHVFPVHKLFAGTECLAGHDLAVEFLEYHRNEKLKMTHRLALSDGGLPVPVGFDTAAAPYIRDSTNGGDLVSLQGAGSTVLVVPNHHATLVRTVSQKNKHSNVDQIVYFTVPPTKSIRQRRTRFAESTLEIPSFRSDRLAPEYVNIRHAVDPDGPPDQTPKDLNTLSDAEFESAMANGGHHAAHFTDDSCDGCVEAKVVGLPQFSENIPAFSLVAAPDFMPLADQIEVQEKASVQLTSPLSQGDLPVNLTLPLPSNLSAFAFGSSDTTVTAVVGPAASGPKVSIGGPANRSINFLTDAAANIFAPGWDTSRIRDSVGSDISYLSSSGLGSPFSEDAKLCAALASFWPAAAPDNGRTFGNQGWGNQLPMLDEELGFHPNHERVESGDVASYRGWDGEYGPFIERVGDKLFVNYVAIERSDYVGHALAGRVDISLTAEVQSEELIARHEALMACQRVLPQGTAQSSCLVVFRKVGDWATFGRGRSELGGGGYLLEFGVLNGKRITTGELNRVRKEVATHHICQVGENGIAYKNDRSKFVFHPA